MLIIPFTSLVRTLVSSIGGIQEVQGGDQPATLARMALLLQGLSVLPGEALAFCGRRVGALHAESAVHGQCGRSLVEHTQRVQAWEMLGSRRGMARFNCCWQRLPGCLYCTYVVGGNCSPSAAGFLCLDKLG